MVLLPQWYTEILSVADALSLSPSKWVAIATLRSARNHLALTGGVSLLLYLFPRAHTAFVGSESLVGLLLWRTNNFFFIGLSAVALNPAMYLVYRYLSGALPAVPGSAAAQFSPAINPVSRLLARFFSAVRGGAANVPAVSSNWGFQLTFCLNWLPSLKWAKFLGPMSRVQSVDPGPRGALEAVKHFKLSPEAFFLSDLATFAADRLSVLVCNRLFPFLGLLPSTKPSNRIFFKKCVTSFGGAFLAYIVVARGWVPRLHFKQWNFIDPARDAATIQSLLSVFGDSFFDYLLSKTSFIKQDRPEHLKAIPTENLSAVETALVERVAQVYNLTAQNHDELSQAFNDLAWVPTLTASQRVTLCTIMWAVHQMEKAVASGKMCKSALKKYASHLRRYNHQLDEEFELRQESSVLLAESSSFVVPRPGAVEEQATYTCSVCLGRLTLAQDVLEITHCRHKFHAECVAKWLQKSSQCPMCRFDLATLREESAGENGNVADEAPRQPDERNTTVDVLSRLDELGYVVPHTLDFDEWSVVRYYCHRNGISCNAALSLINDDLLPNQITVYDMVAAPLLWCFDCYQPLLNVVPTTYVDYK